MDRRIISSPIAVVKVGESFPEICDQRFRRLDTWWSLWRVPQLETIVIDLRSTGRLPEVTAFLGIVVTDLRATLVLKRGGVRDAGTVSTPAA